MPSRDADPASQCLVLGEMTTDRLVVALNKADLLPGSGPGDPKYDDALAAASARISKALARTRFAGAAMVPVAAAPGGAGKGGAGGGGGQAGDVSALARTMLDTMPPPQRAQLTAPFLFAVDHCFQVKGHGAVATGTALAGTLKLGDTLELPALAASYKVKSAQVFRRAVSCVRQGDRAGLNLPGLDPALLERGIACAPGSVPTASGIVALVRKVRFFKGDMPSESKCHVSAGHTTVVGKVIFAGARELAAAGVTEANARQVRHCPPGTEYAWQDGLVGRLPGPKAPGSDGAAWQWALIGLDTPILLPAGTRLIGSRLDADIGGKTCRLAWYGHAVASFSFDAAQGGGFAAAPVRLYRQRGRSGVVERVKGSTGLGLDVVGKGLFSKDTDISMFTGMALEAHTATAGGDAAADGAGQPAIDGRVTGAFGKSGKFTATFSGETAGIAPGTPILLPFRKHLFQPSAGGRKAMVQGPLNMPSLPELVGEASQAGAGGGAAAEA